MRVSLFANLNELKDPCDDHQWLIIEPNNKKKK